MKKRTRARSLRRSRGAAMVEAALVFPLLILLVFGMIDFGLLLKDHLALNHVAREVARQYAVGGTPDLAVLSANFGLRSSDVVAGITAPTTQGAQVSVLLTYPHNMIFFGGTRTLTASMIMRRE